MSPIESARPGILVPIKVLDESKTRLRPVLSSDQRRRLTLALVKDLTEVLLQVSGRAHAAFLTGDPRIRSHARQKGITVLPESPQDQVLGERVDRAARKNWYDHDGGLLVLPVDLPWVDSSSLSTLLDACDDSSILLVPDENGRGTNVLWRRPPDAFACQYRGTTSFRAHLLEGRESPWTPRVHHEPSFLFDLDTPRDWERLLQHPARMSSHLRDFVSEYLSEIRQTLRG